MAKSPFQGLLYSPEVLGGIGLLTAGLSGQNPSVAVPQLLQGMKTASMFQAMEDEEEKRKFIKEFGATVPEEDQAFFKAYPKIYLAQKYKKTTPSTKSLFKNGQEKTFDVSKDSQLTEYLDLINNEGWSTVVPKDIKADFATFVKGDSKITLDLSDEESKIRARQLTDDGYTKTSVAIQASSLGELGKGNQTQAGKEIMGATKIMTTLDDMEGLYDPEFLTYIGKAKGTVAELMAKAGMQITDEELENFMIRKGRWEAANQQFFNAYRKEITGVAAGEKEIAFLEQSVPNINDAPQVYLAKVKLQKILTQKIIDRNKEFLATGFQQTRDNNGLPTGKYKKFLEENEIKPKASEVVDFAKEIAKLGYDNKQMNYLLNQTFGVGNWEQFFK